MPDENIQQKSNLLRLDTSSTKKTSYLPKELKFLRACVEVNAYPSPQEKAELGARLNQEVNSIGYWFTNERRRREKLGVKNTRAEEGMVSFKDISMEEEEEDTSLTSLNSEESSSIDEEDSTLPNSTASFNGRSFDEEEVEEEEEDEEEELTLGSTSTRDISSEETDRH